MSELYKGERKDYLIGLLIVFGVIWLLWGTAMWLTS